MKRRHIVALFVILMSVWQRADSVSAEKPLDPLDPAFWTRVEDSEYVGYIIPMDWSATPGDIERFESEVRNVRPHETSGHLDRFVTELHQYRRHYWCRLEGGKKILHVWFFHQESELVKDGDWEKQIVTVRGGGDLFFQVRFDMETEKIIRVLPNHP